MPPKPEPETAPAAEEDDGRVAVTTRLELRHHQYLVQRAAMFGQTPEDHLAGILREFRAHHDTRRPDHMPRPAEPGLPASTMRGRG